MEFGGYRQIMLHKSREYVDTNRCYIKSVIKVLTYTLILILNHGDFVTDGIHAGRHFMLTYIHSGVSGDPCDWAMNNQQLTGLGNAGGIRSRRTVGLASHHKGSPLDYFNISTIHLAYMQLCR